MKIPSPIAVKERHEKRRLRELTEFLDTGQPGDTYGCTNGKRIAIRKVVHVNDKGVQRVVTVAYMGERRTWDVPR